MIESPSSDAPCVSVIMPAWNAMRFIHAAIDSVLSQSFADLELIVINDGSSDGDYKALEALDPRVRVFEGGRGGVSRARNLGMAAARGRYIAFIDADDLWVPGKLKAQVEYLDEHPDVAIVFGDLIRWWPDQRGAYPDPARHYPTEDALRTPDPSRSGWLYRFILMGFPLGMITPMIRREVHEKVGGFDVSLSRGEDYDFWLRCSREFRMQGFRVTMALYRMHPASTMHQVVERNHLTELLERSVRQWGLCDPDGRCVPAAKFRRRLGRAHFDHGYQHYWQGQPAIAAQSFAASFRHGCLMVRSVVYWVLSQVKRWRRRATRGLPTGSP